MRAILWCNGDLPEEKIVNNIIDENITIFGIDGGANKAHNLGIKVHEIIGDMDSVDTNLLTESKTELYDQSKSDLTKSLDLLIGRGFDEIDIIGVDGGSSEHILGIWASLYEAVPGCKIRAIHQNRISVRYHPSDGDLKISMKPGTEFSIFSMGKTESVTVTGAKWNLKERELEFSTLGLHNISIDQEICIRSNGKLIVILPNHYSSE